MHVRLQSCTMNANDVNTVTFLAVQSQNHVSLDRQTGQSLHMPVKMFSHAAENVVHAAPCGAGAPLFPLVYLSPFLLFPFFHWFYLFSSFVHPFPFYQNSPMHSVSRPEVVGGDRTWV